MAARDNQGLQIALIIFVMLTIVLSVTTFMFFRKFEEAEIKEKSATAKTAESLKKELEAQEEATALKKVLGAGPRDTRQVIEDNAKEDIKAFGANFKEADQHYRQLVKYLHTELAASNALFVDAKQREEQLKAKLAAEEKVKLAEIAKYKDTFDKSVTDLNAERVNFNTDREQYKDATGKQGREIEVNRRKLEDDNKKLVEENQALGRQIEKYAMKLKEALLKLRDKEQYADTPRGKITWVDQRGRVVWLNVGTAEGLRRQITFKVLAADETNLVDGKKKGSIEVTRLLDKHLAEARILDDDLSDPIMPGDQIFSKIWIPGRVEHFALAGFMDIDGDHQSDRKRILNVIAANGGIIDAQVGDDGKRIGEVTLNTRYLIMGERPTDKTGSAEFLKAYSDILHQAEEFGVQKISLEQFLDNIGYQTEQQTVSLDANAQATDFKTKPLDGSIPRQSNAPFKARRPTPTNPKPSAY